MLADPPPLAMNTGTNLPAEIKIAAVDGDAYKFMFMAKGGGSANKSYLFQETKAVLNPAGLLEVPRREAAPARHLGLPAVPPRRGHRRHVGRVRARDRQAGVSTRYLDTLPTEGSAAGHGFRDLEMEAEVLKLTQDFGIGAQFGGKYFCHDVRVDPPPPPRRLLPGRHRRVAARPTARRWARSPPRACSSRTSSATRPSSCPRSPTTTSAATSCTIDLNRPMDEIRAELTRYPVKTRLSLTGTVVVARDIAHAKIAELLDGGGEMPQYLRDHPVYYAGPAKTPEGYASGSFGPTTAGRMDSYVDSFQAAGGSLVMLAKGNRSQQVTDACKAHGGFYLGSIGGPAARLAQDCIRKVEVLEYPELGMEAVWRIEVEDFPAFIVVDDKGNDFFEQVTTPVALGAEGLIARCSSRR